MTQKTSVLVWAAALLGAFATAPVDAAERDYGYRLDEAAYGHDRTRERGWYDDERPRGMFSTGSYTIMRTPVTNAEYAAFVGETGHPAPDVDRETWASYRLPHPYERTRRHAWRDGVPPEGRADHPVVLVSHDDAVAFAAWLSERTGKQFRLPTEAEREYAARGGREGALYPWGDEPPHERHDLGFDPQSGGPARVGVNPPNGFGLYDMSEGVHEWCSDYYDYHYYRYAPERNPQGAPAGTRRASRGGSWRHQIKFSRCAQRSSLPPSFRYADYGFRVALTIAR